ncbi:uncharacterized protein [Battus philenor]|uniref:uncharacterized protein n=1 Tax=Battus philenor TaxID=42288 RepID=UPI0035D0D473
MSNEESGSARNRRPESRRSRQRRERNYEEVNWRENLNEPDGNFYYPRYNGPVAFFPIQYNGPNYYLLNDYIYGNQPGEPPDDNRWDGPLYYYCLVLNHPINPYGPPINIEFVNPNPCYCDAYVNANHNGEFCEICAPYFCPGSVRPPYYPIPVQPPHCIHGFPFHMCLECNQPMHYGYCDEPSCYQSAQNRGWCYSCNERVCRHYRQ